MARADATARRRGRQQRLSRLRACDEIARTTRAWLVRLLDDPLARSGVGESRLGVSS